MNIIEEIYKSNYMDSRRFSYVGTLRNEKIFKINEIVFFAPFFAKPDIAQGKIVGVELPPDDNPEYIYKLEIPKELVINDFNGKPTDRVELECDKIFSTLEEAKESAKRKLECSYKLQKKEIERYFKQFDKK